MSGPGLTLLYFSISGLDLLGKLDEISAEATIEYIYSFQSPFDGHGGFYGYPKAGLETWFNGKLYIQYHPFSGICLRWISFVLLKKPQTTINNKTYPLSSSYFLSWFFASSTHGRWTRPLSGWLWECGIGQGEVEADLGCQNQSLENAQTIAAMVSLGWWLFAKWILPNIAFEFLPD